MGEKIAVVNASPLIFLARADLLDILRGSADVVMAPTAVADEIRRRGPTDPTARAMDASSWLQVLHAPALPPEIQAWDLGPGESAVLAVVLSAKRKGKIPSARIVIERLVRSGMYLSSRVIDDALKLVGE